MPGQYPPPYDEDFLMRGQPSGSRISNLPWHASAADISALTTQVMLSVALPLQPGDLVTSLSFVSGDTAADTPLNWWFALYSNASTPALLAQSADQTTGAWAANTVKTLALATAQLITVPGVYYAAIMMKATTPCTLVGTVLQNAVLAGAISTALAHKIKAQTSGAALTTTAPSTIATPTTVKNVPLVIAS